MGFYMFGINYQQRHVSLAFLWGKLLNYSFNPFVMSVQFFIFPWVNFAGCVFLGDCLLCGSYPYFQHVAFSCFSLVSQSLSRIQLFATPWTAACQASLSITNSWSLLKLMSIELVMPSNHLIFCCLLLLLPSVFLSLRVFSKESVLRIRWPKDCGFSFSLSPSNEYSGLISFRIEWFELLAVQGTLKSLLQHHSSKASILQCSAFSRRRQWHPTPVLLPGKSHGWRSLVGCSPWGR